MTCPCKRSKSMLRGLRALQRYTAAQLERRRTLSTGQCDDLKVDTGRHRVWLSRCTRDDGEPYNNKVTVEQLVGGRWVEVETYRG
jgi:hypothetical protein